MKKKLAIGVLAFNEEKHIESVISNLLLLDYPIFIVDDFSSDKTLEIINKFKSLKNIFIIENLQNLGAGESTKKLLENAKSQGFDFLVKIDGDGQFSHLDVKKIINLYNENNFEFIKSNRFWSNGIIGDIPKIRFFGNLLATLFLQIISGSNKIYDPLNGLIGLSIKITEYIDDKYYPKRYGYPYFLTLTAVINNFRTHQINNVVEYGNQKSNLNSVRVFLTILKLSWIFYFRKLKNKKIVGKYQRSAFFDILFLWSSIIFLILFFVLIRIAFFSTFAIISTSNLLLILVMVALFSSTCFIISYKEEKNIRDEYISVEN